MSNADPRQDIATVTPQLQHEVEQFLYHEAQLLDERRFRDWFHLLADDLSYRMPLRSNRLNRDAHLEFSAADEACYFDETKDTMDRRLRRLETGFAWAEDPASRTRHMVTNVRIQVTSASTLHVRSYFYLYRSRLERQIDEFVGERRDVLRRVRDSFEIVEREILIDQATLQSNNLSMFF